MLNSVEKFRGIENEAKLNILEIIRMIWAKDDQMPKVKDQMSISFWVITLFFCWVFEVIDVYS